MAFQPGAMIYTQGFSSRPENVEVPHIEGRAPTSADTNYPIGKRWIATFSSSTFTLTNLITQQGITTATWV